jgi:hypothetical protein
MSASAVDELTSHEDAAIQSIVASSNAGQETGRATWQSTQLDADAKQRLTVLDQVRSALAKIPFWTLLCHEPDRFSLERQFNGCVSAILTELGTEFWSEAVVSCDRFREPRYDRPG